MTTYNTGNPVGSVDAKDLYDNAQNLDHLVNDRTVTQYADRLGALRKTFWGMEQDFNSFLANSQFEYPPLPYAAGLVVQRATQVIDRAGQLYRVRLPATFPVTLSGTWATDAPLLTAMSDASLRQDLAGTDGGTFVGYKNPATGSIQTTIQAKEAERLSVKDFGAVGNGIADDAAAIQAALNAGRQTGTPPSTTPFFQANLTVHVPKGVYMVSTPLVVPAGVNLSMDYEARIKASAAMPAVITSEQVDYRSNIVFGFWEGGIIDANGWADSAIWPKYFAYLSIRDMQLWNAKINYARLGSSGAPSSSYECFMSNMLMRRDLGSLYPTNSVGIAGENVGDSHFSNCIIMGVQRGVQGNFYDCKFDRVHVWNPHDIPGFNPWDAGVGLGTGFSLAGSECILTQCQVDGPFVDGGTGYYLAGARNSLLGCSVNGDDVHDGQSFGVYLDTGAKNTIMGCTFKGQDATHRLQRDIGGPGLAGSTLFGNQSSNCLTVTGARGNNISRAWVVFNGTGTPAIRRGVGVASITDQGVGNWDVNFIEPMADTEYLVLTSGYNDGLSNNALVVYSDVHQVGSVRIKAVDPITNAAADGTRISVEIKEAL